MLMLPNSRMKTSCGVLSYIVHFELPNILNGLSIFYFQSALLLSQLGVLKCFS